MTTVRADQALQLPAKPRHIGASPLTTERQRWQVYEAAKHLWEAQHPGASCYEHEAAMREIARRHGV